MIEAYNYAVACAAAGKEAAPTLLRAEHRACQLSLALCPQPAEVRDATNGERVALYVDGFRVPEGLEELIGAARAAGMGTAGR